MVKGPLDLQVSGQQVLGRELARWKGRMLNVRPALESIADQFAVTATKQFLTQGAYGGKRWDPLSAKYKRRKAKKYPGRPILVATGKLRRELTHRPFGAEEITDHTLSIGVSPDREKILGYHRSGTANMPARNPLRVAEADKRAMAKTVQRYITTGQV